MRHAGKTKAAMFMRVDQRLARKMRIVHQSMIPKKPAPDLIRGGSRFSEEIMLQSNI